MSRGRFGCEREMRLDANVCLNSCLFEVQRILSGAELPAFNLRVELADDEVRIGRSAKLSSRPCAPVIRKDYIGVSHHAFDTNPEAAVERDIFCRMRTEEWLRLALRSKSLRNIALVAQQDLSWMAMPNHASSCASGMALYPQL